MDACRFGENANGNIAVDITVIANKLGYELHADGIPYRLREVAFAELWDYRTWVRSQSCLGPAIETAIECKYNISQAVLIL